MIKTLQDLYDAELHVKLFWFWDAGVTGQIYGNGEMFFECHADSVNDVVKKLCDYANQSKN